MRTATIYAFLLLAGLCALPVLALEPPPFVNVVDYGATPDINSNDDATGIMAAITAACAAGGPRKVYFPRGQYVITTTLNLGRNHKNLHLFGTGIWSSDPVPSTQITWNGVGAGAMLNCFELMGLRISDIAFNGDLNNDGVKKAGKIIRMNSSAGYPSAQWLFERVFLHYADEGLVCGDASTSGNSDCTMVDFGMEYLTTGFHAVQTPANNFRFVRPQAVYCDTCFNLEQGGSMQASMVSGGRSGIIFKISGGDVNAGPLVVSTMRVEAWLHNGKRAVILDAAGNNTQAIISGMINTVCDVDNDDTTPVFQLSGGAQVTVKNSMIYSRKVASLTGAAGVWPSWLRFEQCTFGNGPDPRLTVSKDAFSGYDFIRCNSGNGMMPDTTSAAAQHTPTPPTNVTATVDSETQITVNWTDITGEDGYRVYQSMDNVNWAMLVDKAPNSTSQVSPDLMPGATYYFKVASYLGNASAEGLYASATTPAANSRPDLLLKKHADAAFIGDDVYDPLGNLQQAGISTPIDQIARYDFVIQNDIDDPDSFKITGSGGGLGWTVRYFKDFGDLAEITAEVTGAGSITGMLNTGESLPFHAEVIPDNTVARDEQNTVQVSAVSAQVAGPTDSVKIITTRAATRKPDATIRTSGGAAVGAGVYSADGTGQTVTKSVLSAQTAQYFITVINQGELPDLFLIHGTTGGANWAVQYFDAAGADITAEVIAGTWSTPSLDVGEQYTVRADITPNQQVAGNDSRQVLISAESAADATIFDVVKSVTIKAPLTGVSLRAAPFAGAKANQPITLTATPVGGGNIEYKFTCIDPAAHTIVIRAYGGANSCAWTPAVAGLHQVTVWAHEVGDPAPFNASATVTYNIEPALLSAVAVNAAPQADKTWLFTATPTGGLNVQYKFLVLSGSTWKDVQAYSTLNTCRWRPAKAGPYSVRVYAKETRDGSTVEISADKAFRVTTVPPPPARLTAVRLTATPDSPRPLNTAITLTANPVGGNIVEYRFRVYDGKTWVDLQPYGPVNTIVWTPVKKATYTLAAYAHEVGSSTTTQVTTSIRFVVE